jgi:hypothetical protein
VIEYLQRVEIMIILLSKGNKILDDIHHLYLHRALTWGQVIKIIGLSYEVQALCLDIRGNSLEQEDLGNLETVRLAQIPVCILLDKGYDITSMVELSNISYGIDTQVKLGHNDKELAEFLSELVGIDVTRKVLTFMEKPKELEVNLGSLAEGDTFEIEIDILGVLDEDNLLGDLDEIDVLDEDNLLGDLDEIDV